MKPEVLIITGDGLNCECETSYAFELAGADPRMVHITDILDGTKRLGHYTGLAFIGGFSNGDHLGAGRIQASRFKHRLRENLEKFVQDRKPVIGICNGFQTLTRLGILPGNLNDAVDGQTRGWTQTATIMTNNSGIFEDRWVHLIVEKDSPCIWTKGLKRLFLPVRHGEGKFYTDDPDLIPLLLKRGQVAVRYTDSGYNGPVMEYPGNPNGSLEAAAGICDETGTIFGLMPHPEACLFPHNHPSWTREQALGKALRKEGEGLAIFRNAVSYMKEL